MMKSLHEKLKGRMRKDRTAATISIRLPEDLIGDLKEMAALLGYSGYESLVRSYIGQGMRENEAMFYKPDIPLLREVLQNRLMSDSEVEDVVAEVLAGTAQSRL